MEPNIHEAQRRERRGRRLPALIILGVIVVIGATWMGLLGFLGGNAAFGTAQDLEDEYVCEIEDLDLSFPDLTQLSEVYTSDGAFLGVLTERNSRPVALDEIPDVVIAALLSAEDRLFYDHQGINFQAIFRAMVSNIDGASQTGGSTITQQVVKQNFLTAERTIERKLCEAVVAAELEQRYTKDQILEFYANSVFFGSNAYGVRAASFEYFAKDLDELTIAEAAALFIPVRNPTFYHPRRNPDNVFAARNRVIDEMAANGFITTQEAAAAKQDAFAVVPHEGFEDLAPEVMTAVRRELLSIPTYDYGLGETYAERKRSIFGCPAADTACEGGGGLQIHITVDQSLQEKANEILRAWFRGDPDGPTGSIAMVDNETGAIRVMSSGVEFGTDIEAGERPYDIARLSARQPGSAFKPFTLAAALQDGTLAGSPVTLGSYWDRSSPYEYQCDSPCSADGDVWIVDNYRGGTPHDLVTLSRATTSSINTVYARVVEQVGPQAVVEMSQKLGVTSPYLQAFPSITLGSFGVSPLDMAAAFSTLANYGTRNATYLIERIETADGTTIYRHDSSSEDVLSPAIASAVVETLRDVVESGTGTRARIGRPQAGKTGTATESVDVWFVGFIPQLTTAVWVGYPDEARSLEDFTVWNDLEGENQFFSGQASGGRLAAPIWAQFMLDVTAGLSIEDFPPPPPASAVYFQTPFVRVPDVEGMSDEEIIEAMFAIGLRPVFEEVPSPEPAGAIVGQDPLPGTRLRQNHTVVIEVSTGVPEAAPLPELTGLTTQAATAELQRFRTERGVRLNWIVQQVAVSNPASWNRVVATNPPPGSLVSEGETITIIIGIRP